MDMDVQMRGSVADLGAYLDSDGSRCIVYGRRGFPVPSGMTAAVVTSHYHAIPFFLKHKLNGVARAYNTPSCVDNVAQEGNLKVTFCTHWLLLASSEVSFDACYLVRLYSHNHS